MVGNEISMGMAIALVGWCVLFIGLITLIKPLIGLKIPSRKIAAKVLVIGFIIILIGGAIGTSADNKEKVAIKGEAVQVPDEKKNATKHDSKLSVMQLQTILAHHSQLFGLWRSYKEENGCTERVFEFSESAYSTFIYNNTMRKNGMEPVTWRFEAQYHVNGDVIFVKSVGKGGEGIDAYRKISDRKFERLAVIKPDGSKFGDNEKIVPPLDILSAGQPSGSALVRCGVEAGRFIASLDSAQNDLIRTQHFVRNQIGINDDITLAYNLAWMSEADQKCGFLEKDFLGNKYNSQLFNVTAGTNENLRTRMNMEEYNAAIKIGVDDAKIDSCNSPILKKKFWTLWETVKKVR